MKSLQRMALFSILLCFTSKEVAAQNKRVIYKNFSLENPTKDSIYQVLEAYLNDNKNTSKYFCAEDIKKYPSVDLVRECCGLSGSFYMIYFKVNVLYIKQLQDYYVAKTMLYWPDNSDSTNIKTVVFATNNYLFKKENGDWKLENYLNYYTSQWAGREIGDLHYYYPKSYAFNENRAKATADFYTRLLKKFEIPEVKKLSYYIADDCDQIYRMQGLDYFMGEGYNGNICGFYDDVNSIIYSTAHYGEAHLHEIIHALNKHFPNSNSMLQIGLSAYINDAGTRNLPILYHIEKLEKHLQTHEMDFEKFETLENLDETTNLSYIFGALICNAIYRKGGMPLLIDYMKSSKNTVEFKSRLLLDLEAKTFQEFFTNEIEIYKKQGKSLLYI